MGCVHVPSEHIDFVQVVAGMGKTTGFALSPTRGSRSGRSFSQSLNRSKVQPCLFFQILTHISPEIQPVTLQPPWAYWEIHNVIEVSLRK